MTKDEKIAQLEKENERLKDEVQRYKDSMESCINMMEDVQLHPIKKQLINLGTYQPEMH